MKKSLLLIFLASIVLAGCSSKLTQEQLFEKKQECASYKDKIQADFSNDNKFNTTEIFYGQNGNSCFHAYSRRNLIDGKSTTQFFIDDILTEEPIYTSTLVIDNLVSENEEGIKFHEKIKNLKGE